MPGPSKQGQGQQQAGVHSSDPLLPLRKTGFFSSSEKILTRKAPFGPSQLMSQYFEENLFPAFTILGCICHLTLRKPYLVFPQSLDFTGMVLFSLLAEKNV